MKKIAVFTGSRADYGLLRPLLHILREDTRVDLQLIVSGSHLSMEHGMTVHVIEKDGFQVAAKVDMLLSSDSAVAAAKSIGIGTMGFADALDRLQPDLLVVLGDRFEALAIAQAALILQVPIAHLHGGEITEGAYDDAIRHALTKFASLHFVSTESHRRRVLQMGEAPDTVFNVGAFGIDQAQSEQLLDTQAISKAIGFDLEQHYVLMTYHPVTQAKEDASANLKEALDQFKQYRVVLTGANADNGGRALNEFYAAWQKAEPERVYFAKSLGSQLYLSLMRSAAAVIGNSSSGLIEAPFFGIPTVNIGCRQRGRTAASSVIHCDTGTSAIRTAIEQAIAEPFRERCRTIPNPYGRGGASREAANIMLNWNGSAGKRFRDLQEAA